MLIALPCTCLWVVNSDSIDCEGLGLVDGVFLLDQSLGLLSGLLLNARLGVFRTFVAQSCCFRSFSVAFSNSHALLLRSLLVTPSSQSDVCHRPVQKCSWCWWPERFYCLPHHSTAVTVSISPKALGPCPAGSWVTVEQSVLRECSMACSSMLGSLCVALVCSMRMHILADHVLTDHGVHRVCVCLFAPHTYAGWVCWGVLSLTVTLRSAHSPSRPGHMACHMLPGLCAV
jgi:hypothetical protein